MWINAGNYMPVNRVSDFWRTLFAHSLVPALLLVGLPVMAATPTPGTVISPIDKPVYQPEKSAPPPVEQKKKPAFTPPGTTKKISIKQFTLSGNTAFSDDALQALIAQYQDSMMTLPEIYHVADIIQDYYRHNGYLLASVFLPAQKVSSGTVRLEIVEGRLGRKRIDGELGSYSEEFLVRQLNQIRPGEIIEKDVLEGETLLLNELPGLEARAVIARGEQAGHSDVIMKVEEDRTSGTVRVNNYGRESIGEVRLEGGLLYANPFSQGDMLNLSAIVSESSQMVYGRVDYDALLNTSGTRAGFALSTFDYDVDTSDLGLAGTLDGDGTNISFRIMHPLKRVRRSSLDLGAVLRRNESNESGDLSSTTSGTAINVLDMIINWQLLHLDNSQSSFSAMLSTNFQSNDDGTKDDAEKARLTLDYSYAMPFSENWFMLLRANAVASADPLADVERYRVGGPDNVRAYPSAELAGDGGGFASIDVGKTFYQERGLVYSAKVFADAGRVKRKIPLAGEKSSESLAGYGIGFSATIERQHYIEFQIVEPSSDDRVSSDNRDTRVWLSYSAQL